MGNSITTRKENGNGTEDLMFQALFERSVDAMLLLEDGKFIECNQAAAKMLCSSREEILRLRPADISPEKQPDGSNSVEKSEEMTQIAHEKGSHLFDWLCCRPNGEKFYAEIHLTLLPWGNGQVILASLRDISDRIHYQQVIAEREIQYRTLIDSYQDGVFLIQDSIIQLVNPIIAELSGYTAEEMVGLPFANLVAPEDLPRVAENYRVRIEGQVAPAEYDFNILHRDGQTRVLVSLRAINIEYRGRPAVLGTIRKITEQMKVEAQLQEAQRRLQTVVSSNPMILFSLDANGIFTLLEGRGLADLGLKPGDVLGRSALDVYRDEPALVADIRRGLAGESFQKMVQVGEKFYNTTYSPLLNDNGQLAGTIGIYVNITEQVKLLSTARDAERRFRSVIETAPIGMHFYQIQEDGKLVLVDASPAASKILGFDHSTIIGKPIDEAFPGLMETEVPGIYRKVAQEGGEWRTDQIVYHEGLITGAYEVVAFQTLPGSMVATFTDATERKRAEAERARLTAILEATNDFVAIANMQGKLLYMNKAGRVMLELDKVEDLDQFKIADSHPAPVAELVEQVGIPSAIQNGIWTAETAMLSQSGKEIPLLQTIMAHYSESGQVEFISTIARDISERKQMEKQQQEMLTRRGYQVQVSTEIAQEIASAQALKELFRRVVILVKERFGYYHTQLLQFDPALNAVVLVEGYGEIGAKMLAAGHRMEMGRGLIGVAAATGQTVMRQDTASDPDWRSNPLLPETRGEIAVPIKYGERILGVLDVQSSQANAITGDDRLMLEGLCGQIAIAIEGTTLRQQMQERLEELNSLYRATSREGWKSFQEAVELPEGFVYEAGEVRPGPDIWVDEIEKALQENRLVTPEDKNSAAVSPLSVRGEVIGALGIFENPDHPLSPEELSLIEQVSDQVALALENARLFEQTRLALGETEEQAQKLAALNDMSAALNRAGDAQEAMTLAAQKTLQIMQGDRASIAILDSSGEMFEIYSLSGMEGLIPQGHHLPVVDTAIGLAIRENRVVMLPQDAPMESFMDSRMLASQGMHMAICAPLMTGVRVVGSLNVATAKTGLFDAQDGNLMAQIASALAATIQNRRLFEQIQRTLVETETLYNFSRRLSEAPDLRAVLKSVAEAMRISEINRAVLIDLEYDEQGNVVAGVVKANWHNGVGKEPTEIGRRFEMKTMAGIFNRFLTTEPQFYNETSEQSREQGVFSLCGLPLWIGNHQIGIILLETAAPYTFTDEDKRPAASLAQQAAIAVQGRSLFEETLASETRFRSTSVQLSQALAVARMGYFEYYPLQDQFLLNDQVLAVLDRTVEEIGGYTLSAQQFGEFFLYEEDYDLVPNAMAEALQSQEQQVAFGLEHPFRRRNGSRGFVNTRLQALKDDQGQVVRLTGAVQDISERKAAEQMLESNRRTLQAVLDNMPAGVFMVEAPSGKPILSNRRAEEFLGRGISPSATGDDLNEVYQAYRFGTDDLYPPAEMPVVAGMFGQAKMIDDMEVRRPDGSRALLQVNGAPMIDETGKVLASVVVFQDISEARKAQETIAKRAAELATVAEVSTAVSTLQNPDEMLQTVVDLTRQAFDLYHAHIYLVNDSGDALVLAKGSGEVGRRMVAEGRRISTNAEKSLVARAARMRHGVIVNDVRQEPDFLPHPLLPLTRSEMAVPMIVGGNVLGVIDIQDQKEGRFTPEDVNIITTLATQVAVSLQNARSYARAQRQAEREALINAISERIQSTDSIESALQVAVREIGRALGAQHTVIRLGLERKEDNQ